jgi:hypothetical protein
MTVCFVISNSLVVILNPLVVIPSERSDEESGTQTHFIEEISQSLALLRNDRCSFGRRNDTGLRHSEGAKLICHSEGAKRPKNPCRFGRRTIIVELVDRKNYPVTLLVFCFFLRRSLLFCASFFFFLNIICLF